MKNFNPTKTKFLFLIFIISTSYLFAQTSKDFDVNFDKAYKVYEVNDAGSIYQALPMFLELYYKDSANANLAYLIGDCYIQARSSKARSIPYFKKASLAAADKYKKGSSTERKAPLLAHKKLGDAYHIDSQFDKAIVAYQAYKQALIDNKEKDSDNVKEADRKIEMCLIAKELIANPIRIKIEDMGKSVNSYYADYSPVISADQSTMIFTSRRSGSLGGQTYEGGKFYEDLYISHKIGAKWSDAQNMGTSINTEYNEASVGLSPDGQELLIYKDDNGDGNIYYTSLNGNDWMVPIKLNENINSKYWEPSAFISADGQRIYFSSNRPGGFGGRDLYVSNKNDEGEWGKAVNMGEKINTEYDEDAPFIHPDGVTLFFSSNGHKTMGGFDIFYAELSEDGNQWLPPVNVGYPINSPDDDIFYVVSADKKNAYYSSFKEGGLGEKDTYRVTFLDPKIAALTMIKGVVKDANNLVPKGILITVTDNETGKVVGRYKPNSATGQYLFVLPAGKNYNIAYEAEGYLFYSENTQIPKKTNYYEINRDVILPPVNVGSKIVLNNIFFDFDKSELRPTSNVELTNIIRVLNKYPKISVEIGGYTDSKGTPEYNKKLSLERAMEVVNYLAEKGISKTRLIPVGYGETSPNAANKNTDGTDSPEGRQLNRCAEMKIVNIK